MNSVNLRRLEAARIAAQEMNVLGHRVVYDTKTGWSKNVFGLHVDPRCLDEHGYEVMASFTDVELLSTVFGGGA